MSRSTWKPDRPGQHQIEDDAVVVCLVRLIPGVASVVQHVDRVAFLFQTALDEAGDLSIVFHYQDAHACLAELELILPFAPADIASP